MRTGAGHGAVATSRRGRAEPGGRGARPADDPRPSMPPAAAHLLEAAQRVLLTKGFRGLTLRAIAQESGENSAMVQYYFGNKDGLVRAMIDSVFRDDQQDAAAAMNAAMGDERLPAFVEALRTISSSRSYRVFFDILPYALRNEGLRSRMARVYDWYRLIKCDWLRGKGEPSPPEREALLGRGRAHDRGGRRARHPGGHRRRLRRAAGLRRARVHAAALAAGAGRARPARGSLASEAEAPGAAGSSVTARRSSSTRRS